MLTIQGAWIPGWGTKMPHLRTAKKKKKKSKKTSLSTAHGHIKDTVLLIVLMIVTGMTLNQS